MKNQDFTITLWAEQTPEKIFPTILDVKAWWSGLHNELFEGSSEKPGDEFSFLAGGGAHYTKQKMIALVPNRKVTWLVTEATLSFVDTPDEWEGTTICFELSQESGKTKIVFTHIGLVPELACYNSCAPAWTQYLQERLSAAIAKTN